MKPRNEPSELEQLAAQSCFRGKVLAPAYDTSSRLITVQGTGHGGVASGSTDYDTPETVNAVPVLFPYGFAAMPPADVELLYQETPAGLVVVSQRAQLPSGVPNLATGDSLQYSSGGSYTHHDADGDTIHEPNDGKYIIFGDGRNAAKLALDGDSVVGSADFVTWLNAVAVAAGYGTPWDVTPTPVKTIGYVSGSATKAKAEH